MWKRVDKCRSAHELDKRKMCAKANKNMLRGIEEKNR